MVEYGKVLALPILFKSKLIVNNPARKSCRR